MGNQREVKQTEPLLCCGALLRIRPGAELKMRETLDALKSRFYTWVLDAEGPVSFPNLDGQDTEIGPQLGAFVVVQSGGKMWCGYPSFIEHISELAPLLEDAVFYVGDEEDYVDEFRIHSGGLFYRRVHEGGWVPVTDYLLAEGIVDGAAAKRFDTDQDSPTIER